MEIIHGEQAGKFRNDKNCFGIVYPLKDKDIDLAVIEITGRSPVKGRAVNLECKELVYIIRGSGMVVVEGKRINLRKGDLVLIKQKEKYYFEGKMTMIVPCAPAWRPDQHKETK